MIVHAHLPEGHGFSRVAVVSDDIGSYGRDLGLSLVDLLDALGGLKPAASADKPIDIFLNNLHAEWFVRYFDAVVRWVQQPHACKWLSLGVQSASRKVLRDMARPYSVPALEDCLRRLTRAVPDVRFDYDMIVGFPTETEEDFQASLCFLQAHPPSRAEIIPFSAEPGTPAADLPPLPEAVVSERRYWMECVCKLSLRHEKRVGSASLGESEDRSVTPR